MTPTDASLAGPFPPGLSLYPQIPGHPIHMPSAEIVVAYRRAGRYNSPFQNHCRPSKEGVC